MDLNNPFFITYFFTVFFLIIFTVIYVRNRAKVKKKKIENIGEMNYLIHKFNLNKKKINYKKEILPISLINSFIITSVGTFVTCLDIPVFLQLSLGFVLLFALIYSLYEIYGRSLERKLRRDEK